ncbi:MAG: Kdo hydroxylase family protein [Methylobacter sp.]|nr:Kdo hydroxylase family protein [Methylobacter sp.]
MTTIINIQNTDWNQECSPVIQKQALSALEEGNVLFFPQLSFKMADVESQFLSLTIVGKSKNVSFDVSTGKLRGSEVGEVETTMLQNMMQRFAIYSNELLFNLLPYYKADLVQSQTSFRPVEVAGRSTSWRKDDTRLHVDSFPSRPVQDKRILRVFSNVNPNGQGRSWRLGESFENVASRYLPSMSSPVWGSGWLLQLCGITKSRRSAYDHFMLQIHDRMKADLEYQLSVDQINYEFPSGSTWIAFTDQVSHAVMTGQYLLEQTFHLPVNSMQEPSRAPLQVLERLSGRKLT